MLRWILLVVAGAIVAAAAVAYWQLSQYRPLDAASVLQPPRPYTDGEETDYVVFLVNTGRLPVRVTGFNLDSDRPPLLVRTEARLGDTREDSEPFRPFTLDEGELQPVIVLGRFDNCEEYEHGASTRRDVQLVRYRVLGVVPAEQEVKLTRPILVAAPPDEECPARSG